MAFDFEALVGHLYVVGGRAINAQPPGMLVEVAPKKSARGRELDTIFVLVSPSGDATAPAAFYEQMSTLAAERYFNSTGSVTAGLRTIYTSLNQDLIEHNESGKRPYEANLVCAVLHENEVFVSRVGSSVAVIRSGEEITSFPVDFSNDEALVGPPLGVHPVPDIKMSRYKVEASTRLVLGDMRLADMDSVHLAAGLKAAEIADMLTALKDYSGPQITLLAAEFVPPDAPSPVSVKENRTSSRVAAAPPTEGTPAAAPPPPPPPATRPRRVPLVGLRRLVGSVAGFLANVLTGINRMLDRLIPQPAEGQRSWLRTPTALVITILIPVLIVGLVVVLGVGGTGQSEYELCVQEASKTAVVARSIASSDVNGTLAGWNAVISIVDRCNDIRAGDPALAALTREAQNVIDLLFQVERRETYLIESFPNAMLTRVVLQGVDMYTLDSQNQLVYRVTLGEDGRSAVPNSRIAIPSMRLGATVGAFRVGELVDITWSEETTQILALDRTGLLIACSPRFLQSCEAQQLLAAERWVTPTHVRLWQGRLYILDVGANQIWRYESSGGTYANSPSEYFVGTGRPDIRNTVDFGIDDKGSVYILTAQGQITKWVSGSLTSFSFANFPDGQQMSSADGMYLNSAPIAQGIFIVSSANRTIYETTLAGTFSASYRVVNEDDFASLASVVADANQQMIYALSGNSIFGLDKLRPGQSNGS
jgi:hypothetical protein